MTVQELRDKLATLEGTTEVVFYGEAGGQRELLSIESIPRSPSLPIRHEGATFAVTPKIASTRPNHPSSFRRTLAGARSTMAFNEVLHLALDSFRTSKVRSLLTMLGMVIGSASIVLVVTVGMTGKQYALDTISSIGPNKVEMQYAGGLKTGLDNTSTPDFMNQDDIKAVTEQVPGIVASSPMLEDHERIRLPEGQSKDAMLLGVSPQYKTIRNLRLLAGHFFDDEDSSSHAKVAVIVGPLAQELFRTPQDAVGKTISIKGIPFLIIGVFVESVNTFGQSEISDETLLIPYEVVRYFTGSNDLKELFFTMKDISMVEPGAKQIQL